MSTKQRKAARRAAPEPVNQPAAIEQLEVEQAAPPVMQGAAEPAAKQEAPPEQAKAPESPDAPTQSASSEQSCQPCAESCEQHGQTTVTALGVDGIGVIGLKPGERPQMVAVTLFLAPSQWAAAQAEYAREAESRDRPIDPLDQAQTFTRIFDRGLLGLVEDRENARNDRERLGLLNTIFDTMVVRAVAHGLVKPVDAPPQG